MKESYTNLGNVTVPILYWMPWSVNFDLNFVVGEVCMYMCCRLFTILSSAMGQKAIPIIMYHDASFCHLYNEAFVLFANWTVSWNLSENCLIRNARLGGHRIDHAYMMPDLFVVSSKLPAAFADYNRLSHHDLLQQQGTWGCIQWTLAGYYHQCWIF